MSTPSIGDTAICGCNKPIIFRKGNPSRGLADYWTHADRFGDAIYGSQYCSVMAAPKGADALALTAGTRLVAQERNAHPTRENYTSAHDDATDGELAAAGACYVNFADVATVAHELEVPAAWPWHARYWKPASRVRMLVKGAALIIAEIDRLLRAEKAAAQRDGTEKAAER